METETGTIQKNRYDAEGLCYELVENGRRTSFVHHNGELLHEKGEEAGLFQKATSYYLGAGIEAFQRDRKTFYYHQDEQLNTTLITDEERKLRNHYQYDAFGAGLDASEALPNRIRYTGQQYDEQTGQYYLRARYYNLVLGRFMQEDVYQGDGLNLYAYCANNPVIYYDPSGYVLSQADLNNILRDSNSSNNFAYYQNKTHRDGFKNTTANPAYYEGISFQSHHLLQGEWAKANLKIYGYHYNKAPTISLGTGWYEDKNNIWRRAPHTIANNRQEHRKMMNNGNFKLTNLNEELLFGAQDLYIAGLSKELVLSELERNYKYLDSLNELKKTEIDSGKLKPIEYDRKKIESQLDEFIKQPHDDESIQSTSCKSKKRNKRRKSMDILKNLNHRLMVDSDSVGVVPGGEEYIKEVIEQSPIQLPEDYLNFLHTISGNEGVGISFLVDQDVDPDSTLTIFIFSARYSFEVLEEFLYPIPDDEFFKNAWMIGNDLGDFVYYYAKGNEGFGLYRDEGGSLCIERAEKIADSLTDFLVKGVGIDVAITYPDEES